MQPISSITCATVSTPLLRPFVTSKRRTEEVASVVVRVELEDGPIGYGSAAETWAVTGESAETMTAAVRGPIAHSLLGASSRLEAAHRIESACARNTSAKAAVDVAVHDAWARALGVPLVEALGGEPTVLTNDMTISLEDPDAMARHAEEATAAGFGILKIKLGSDPAADLDRLRAVHAAAPAARLRVDANQGWDAKGALAVIDGLLAAELPIELVEQPVPAHDLDGLARVTAAAPVPIMADESIASPADAFEIAQRHAADQLNIKLAKCGGITQALAIADVAHAAGLTCMVGAMMEPRLGIAAAAHVAAAHPAITMIDLDSPLWFDLPPAEDGYRDERGTIRLTSAPGLGILPR